MCKFNLNLSCWEEMLNSQILTKVNQVLKMKFFHILALEHRLGVLQ